MRHNRMTSHHEKGMCFTVLVKTHARLDMPFKGWQEIVSQQSVSCVFRCMAPAMHFFCCEDDPMDINFFKDILFDLVNESDELDPYLEDIECDDRNNLMTVITKDGKRYTIHVSVSDN